MLVARSSSTAPRLTRAGMPMLAALLLLTFGVTAVLVREAWRAARAQRELAERAVRDYASYATWSTARLAETNLYGALTGVLREVGVAPWSSHSPPPPLATLLRSVAYVEQCRCAAEIPADYYFRIDFERDSVSGANAASEPREVHEWVPAL